MADAQWKAIGPAPRGHGLLGVLLQRRTPYRTDDIRTDDRFEWWPAAHPVLTSFLGVPIVADDAVLGAIYVANKCDGASFTEDDEYLMTLLAAHAGIGLRHARLYERSRELTIIEERTRIARELHDAVAQKLFSLRLTAEAAATVATSGPGARCGAGGPSGGAIRVGVAGAALRNRCASARGACRRRPGRDAREACRRP